MRGAHGAGRVCRAHRRRSDSRGSGWFGRNARDANRGAGCGGRTGGPVRSDREERTLLPSHSSLGGVRGDRLDSVGREALGSLVGGAVEGGKGRVPHHAQPAAAHCRHRLCRGGGGRVPMRRGQYSSCCANPSFQVSLEPSVQVVWLFTDNSMSLSYLNVSDHALSLAESGRPGLVTGLSSRGVGVRACPYRKTSAFCASDETGFHTRALTSIAWAESPNPSTRPR